MKVVLFCHSLISDWNHGNAHFLRGVVTELLARDHQVHVLEPRRSWSLENLVRDHGTAPLHEFKEAYPQLSSDRYDLDGLDLERVLDKANLVLVHEWNEPELIKRVGEHRARARNYKLFFHDTHHRMVSKPEEMSRYDLRHYDGVLAFGRVIADLYRLRGLAQNAWTWHEGADTRIFRPLRPLNVKPLDLIWIGNWGDEERTEELYAFLMSSIKELGLKAEIYGVRYPDSALNIIKEVGVSYQGWVPNFKVPEKFAQAKLTVHIPRQPYVRALSGIPTIRVFEALACGIPMVSAPWEDAEGLFVPGEDFLMAHNGREMRQQISRVMKDPELAQSLAQHGRKTILSRHTCAHRVDELMNIVKESQ